MASIPDVSVLAFHLAEGCTNMLTLLLRFLGRPSMRNPAIDEAVIFLLLVLLMAYVATVTVAHFAGIVLAYLHLTAPAPASATAASTVYLCRFAVIEFTLVFGWLVVFSMQLAAFLFLGSGKPGIGPGFSWNVLS